MLSHSNVSMMSSRSFVARKSPDAALLTNRFAAIARLLSVLRWPLSWITIDSLSAVAMCDAAEIDPFGRPLGFPDLPFAAVFVFIGSSACLSQLPKSAEPTGRSAISIECSKQADAKG
jgi:hypothetical protein